MPVELAHDLATLALYDIVIFADDSGSMIFEEQGERINDLKVIMARVAEVATMFDEDGKSSKLQSKVHCDNGCSIDSRISPAHVIATALPKQLVK